MPKPGANVTDLDRIADLKMIIEDLADKAKDQAKAESAKIAEAREKVDAANRPYPDFKAAWLANGMDELRILTTIEGKPLSLIHI